MFFDHVVFAPVGQTIQIFGELVPYVQKTCCLARKLMLERLDRKAIKWAENNFCAYLIVLETLNLRGRPILRWLKMSLDRSQPMPADEIVGKVLALLGSIYDGPLVRWLLERQDVGHENKEKLRSRMLSESESE
jgi:hypothetical protein